MNYLQPPSNMFAEWMILRSWILFAPVWPMQSHWCPLNFKWPRFQDMQSWKKNGIILQLDKGSSSNKRYLELTRGIKITIHIPAIEVKKRYLWRNWIAGRWEWLPKLYLYMYVKSHPSLIPCLSFWLLIFS